MACCLPGQGQEGTAMPPPPASPPQHTPGSWGRWMPRGQVTTASVLPSRELGVRRETREWPWKGLHGGWGGREEPGPTGAEGLAQQRCGGACVARLGLHRDAAHVLLPHPGEDRFHWVSAPQVPTGCLLLVPSLGL